jgi:hypothetical protein
MRPLDMRKRRPGRKAKDPFLIFSEGDVKAVTNGKTPLFYACENNSSFIARTWGLGDEWGETPLRYVIARELQDQPTALKIIKLRIKRGAKVNVRTRGLMMAINQKDVERVEVLLEAGVDIQGRTALKLLQHD